MRNIIILILCLILMGCTKKEKLADYSKEISILLEKSYTYSLLSYGNLEFEDATATVEDKKYFMIKNININTLEELNKLIEETFVTEKYDLFYESLYAKKNFLEIDNKLYVVNNIDDCDIPKPDFKKFTITDQTEEYINITIEDFPSLIYI